MLGSRMSGRRNRSISSSGTSCRHSPDQKGSSMTLERFQHFIGGEFCDAAETFESLDPSTERPWAVMPAASADDVNRAVEAAHRMLFASAWADLTPTARGKLLMRLGDLVAQHA